MPKLAQEVTSVVDAIGGPSGGSDVTVFGSGFTGATQVTFGGAPATHVVVGDDFSLTCTIPAHAPGLVDVTVVGVATGVGLFTYDTVDWQQVSIGYAGSNNFRDSIYVPTHGFTFVGDGGLIWQSPTGVTWTARTSPAPGTQFWKGIAYAPALNRYVVTGNSGAVATSDDAGVTWTARTAASPNQWASVCWSPSRALFVAVTFGFTSGFRVMTSPDGITWTGRTAASALSWAAVCWSVAANLFVALANDPSITTGVMTSPDGTTWTSRTSVAHSVLGTAFGGRMLVPDTVLGEIAYFMEAAGSVRTLVHSVNGLTWTAASATTATSGRPERVVDQPALGRLLGIVKFTYLTSPSATPWTETAIPSPPINRRGDFCACWANDLKVLVVTANGFPDVMMRGAWPTIVVAITITPTTLPDASAGVAYVQSLAASGGTAPYLFTLTAGTLPPGLTLSSAGVLAGTPTGTSSTLTPTLLPPGLVDRPYAQQITVPVAPPVPYAFTVRATDINGAFGEQAYTVALTSWTSPATFGVPVGKVPPCLTCSVTGRIAGLPMKVGTTTFTVQATDAVGRTASLVYALTVTS